MNYFSVCSVCRRIRSSKSKNTKKNESVNVVCNVYTYYIHLYYRDDVTAVSTRGSGRFHAHFNRNLIGKYNIYTVIESDIEIYVYQKQYSPTNIYYDSILLCRIFLPTHNDFLGFFLEHPIWMGLGGGSFYVRKFTPSK